MAASVNPDILTGASGNRSATSYEITRVFDVTGLEAAISGQIEEALTHASIPQLGTAHPSATGLVCIKQNAAPLAKANAVRVTCTYGVPEAIDLPPSESEPGIIEVGASLVGKETQVDNLGTSLTVDYTGAPEPPHSQVQLATVTIEAPQVVLREERRESNDPSAKAVANVGYVNSATIWGYSARTLLCRAIRGVSRDGGDSWVVTYEFQYNPDTWDVTIYFKDDETGRVMNGVTAGDGIETYEVYPEKSFASLNLSF